MDHLSAGCKALFTELCYVGTDELRQACGGAGFLLSSGIAYLWKEQASQPSFDGVNTVLYKQCSNLLVKQAARVAEGKAPDQLFAYLGEARELLSGQSEAKTAAEFLDPDHL